jgi:hypothetical protein
MDNSLEDRRVRAVWNGHLRPRGKPVLVQVLQPRSAQIDWANKSANRFSHSEAKDQARTAKWDLSELLERKSRLEKVVLGSSLPRKGVVSLSSIQELEEKEAELKNVRESIATVETTLDTLEWLIAESKAVSTDANGIESDEARFPVLVSAKAGVELIAYAQPSAKDLADLIARKNFYLTRDRLTDSDAWKAVFELAPEQAIKREGTRLVPQNLSDKDASPLLSWTRSRAKNDRPAKNIRELWAWAEIIRAWNSMHMQPKVMLPAALNSLETKPSGNARATAKVQKATSDVEQLRKTVESLMALVEKGIHKVPEHAPESASWWETWDSPGGWMAHVSKVFTPLRDSFPDPRFAFLVRKDCSPRTWAEFSSHTGNTRWTKASEVSFEYLAALAAECLKDRLSADVVNSVLSCWAAGPKTGAKLLDASAYKVVPDVGALGCPFVYNTSKGRMGLWPAIVFATGYGSVAANDFDVAPKDFIDWSDLFEKHARSGAKEWPLDSVFEKSMSVAKTFAELATQKEILSRAAAKRGEGFIALKNTLLVRMHSETDAFRRAAWSDVVLQIDARESTEDPWGEQEVQEKFSRALAQFVTEPPAPVDREDEAAEVPPPVVLEPEVQGEGTIPLTIESNGILYHLVEDPSEYSDTPRNFVVPALFQSGHVYLCGRLAQAPKKGTATTEAKIHGDSYEVFVAGGDWVPLPGTGKKPASAPAPSSEPSAKKLGKRPLRTHEDEFGPSAEVIYEAMTGEPTVKLPPQPAQAKPAPAPPKTETTVPAKAIPPKFPGRSSATQMHACKCDTYPCRHTRSNIRGWHMNAKLPTAQRPKKDGVPVAEDWKTDDLDWPKGFADQKPKKDPLAGPNPAKVDRVPNPYHGDRISPELMSKLRVALRLSEEPLPQGYSQLSPEAKKAEVAKRRVPKWAVAAVAADPTNLAKIADGSLTSASKVVGAPRPRAQVNEKGEPSASNSIGDKWKALKSRFKDVGLWLNPATPREKQLRAAYDRLVKEASGNTASLPKLRRRPTVLPQSNTSPASTSASPIAGLDTLLLVAQALGSIVKALNPK